MSVNPYQTPPLVSNDHCDEDDYSHGPHNCIMCWFEQPHIAVMFIVGGLLVALLIWPAIPSGIVMEKLDGKTGIGWNAMRLVNGVLGLACVATWTTIAGLFVLDVYSQITRWL